MLKYDNDINVLKYFNSQYKKPKDYKDINNEYKKYCYHSKKIIQYSYFDSNKTVKEIYFKETQISLSFAAQIVIKYITTVMISSFSCKYSYVYVLILNKI